ncbi:unnamed protein product [Ambrosiozyma monospora]|uniref:Unnamed protein product n=1 Tax=Ambrosiozyma monospora TaxID=43982 RepID=A0A9W6YRA2_AMBMO|nr:unnamed protein product [Ambrosiozyma monospora]
MSLFKRSSRDKEKKKSLASARTSYTNSTTSNGNLNGFAGVGILNAPTKVVQAISPYIAQRSGELSFQKGDFFHIASGCEADEIIEIHDPVKNIKGKAPSKCFKFFDKTHNHTRPLSTTTGEGSEHGSSSGSSPNMPQRIASVSSSNKKVTPLPSLYGRLLYEFNAERPDELSVAAGDSVIICAHHEYEWFIGKCLDKIGEPGLIPVSYVQLFDIATKVPYKEPAATVIERERLPTVDDWKALKNKHKASARAVGSLALQQNGNGNGSLADLSRSSSLATRTVQELADPYATDVSVESFASTRGKYWYLVRVLLSNGHVKSLCRYYEDFFNFHQLVLKTWPTPGDQKRVIPYIPGTAWIARLYIQVSVGEFLL